MKADKYIGLIHTNAFTIVNKYTITRSSAVAERRRDASCH